MHSIAQFCPCWQALAHALTALFLLHSAYFCFMGDRPKPQRKHRIRYRDLPAEPQGAAEPPAPAGQRVRMVRPAAQQALANANDTAVMTSGTRVRTFEGVWCAPRGGLSGVPSHWLDIIGSKGPGPNNAQHNINRSRVGVSANAGARRQASLRMGHLRLRLGSVA